MEKPKNYKQAKHSGYEIFRIFRSQRNRVLVVMRPPSKMDTSDYSVHFDLSKRFLANIGVNILNYCK